MAKVAALGFLEVLRPNMLLILSRRAVYNSLDHFQHQSGPLTLFASGDFSDEVDVPFDQHIVATRHCDSVQN